MFSTDELKKISNQLEEVRFVFVRINEEDYIIDSVHRDSDSLEKKDYWYYIIDVKKADGIGLKR